MNIQYRHRNCSSAFYPATFCADVPSADAFFNIFWLSEAYIKFNFGFTRLHPKDQYNKAIGREFSFRDMKLTYFHIKRIEIKNNRSYFFLVPVDAGGLESDIFEVAFSYSDLHDCVRFEWVDFNIDDY